MPKRQNTATRAIIFEVEEVIYTTNKDVAFTGADVLLLQIRTGGLEMREKDEQLRFLTVVLVKKPVVLVVWLMGYVLLAI